MSSTTVTFNNGQQIQSEIDLKKLVLFDPIIKAYEHTNSTYDTETFAVGLVCGVNKTTGEVAPYKSTNTDGTEYPCLILAYSYSLEAGTTIKLATLTRGQVRSGMLSFARSGDGLTTLVGDRRVHEVLEDRFILRDVLNATKFDNEI